MTASNIAALAAAKRGEEGVASGLINTSRQVGAPIGIALSISVVGLVTHGAGVAAPPAEVLSAFQDGLIAASAFAALGIVTALLVGGRNPKPIVPAQSAVVVPNFDPKVGPAPSSGAQG